jgi:hypothetical protein
VPNRSLRIGSVNGQSSINVKGIIPEFPNVDNAIPTRLTGRSPGNNRKIRAAQEKFSRTTHTAIPGNMRLLRMSSGFVCESFVKK